MHFAGHAGEHPLLDPEIPQQAGHGFFNLGQGLVHGNLDTQQARGAAGTAHGQVNLVKVGIAGEVHLESLEQGQGGVVGNRRLEQTVNLLQGGGAGPLGKLGVVFYPKCISLWQPAPQSGMPVILWTGRLKKVAQPRVYESVSSPFR